jgi:hypothetical protein
MSVRTAKTRFVTDRTSEIFLTKDQCRFIDILTRINFETTDCAPRSKVSLLLRKISSFLFYRDRDKVNSFLDFYNFKTTKYEDIERLRQLLEKATEAEVGICVTIIPNPVFK